MSKNKKTKYSYSGNTKKGTSFWFDEYDYDYDLLLNQNNKIDSYNYKNKSGGYKKLFWKNKN